MLFWVVYESLLPIALCMWSSERGNKTTDQILYHNIQILCTMLLYKIYKIIILFTINQNYVNTLLKI